jgi:hypothetical protein
MSKRKSGRKTAEVLASKAERINKAAMAQIESDTQQMLAKTERLRALRLAKEAAERTKLDPGLPPA